jgi:pyruvate/2-oxoglutarate dehydrogenase complex dihydrolipoamide acyltransferase (E2) component
LIIEVKMPELGENVTEATIVHWLKEAKDSVQKGEILVEVMTDKVNSEVESPASGIVAELLYAEEAVVKVGETIARIEEKV